MKYVVDLIAECVAETDAKQFLYGGIDEIILRINNMNKTAASIQNKYPLIFMPTGFKEQHSERNDIQTELTIPSLVIITSTNKDLYAEQRKEQNYKTVLEPIYTALLTAIAENPAFEQSDSSLIEHDLSLHYSWGRHALLQSDAINVEFIDAIEITDLKLTIYKSIC